MTANSETSKAVGEAFRAALLLTGSTELAEKAVLDGIAVLESGHVMGDVLRIEPVKSGLQERAAFSGQLPRTEDCKPRATSRILALPEFCHSDLFFEP